MDERVPSRLGKKKRTVTNPRQRWSIEWKWQQSDKESSNWVGFFHTSQDWTGGNVSSQSWKTINWKHKVKTGDLKQSDIFKPLSSQSHCEVTLTQLRSISVLKMTLKDVGWTNDGSASCSWTPVWGCRHTGDTRTRATDAEKKVAETQRRWDRASCLCSLQMSTHLICTHGAATCFYLFGPGVCGSQWGGGGLSHWQEPLKVCRHLESARLPSLPETRVYI